MLQVKLTCGQARWMVDQQAQVEPVLSTSHLHTEMSKRDGVSDESKEGLNVHLHNFLASLTKSRGFYANLAESLCSDESFAETRDTADCWNGQRIGE
ncbi:unnamed protein product [Timema podura]|uniref:Uncharacterized protein n=1 Tax=Timema podura TaxID=61482 RepID=A0ABN7PKE9_TIMPD|nr:unnamed protein product [Timema podura]